MGFVHIRKKKNKSRFKFILVSVFALVIFYGF